jgi:tRNA(His) guanylyltransferase
MVVTATRRRVREERELPMKQTYREFLAGLIAEN